MKVYSFDVPKLVTIGVLTAALTQSIAFAEYAIEQSEITPDRKGFRIHLTTPNDPQLGTLKATVSITKEGNLVTLSTGAGGEFMFDASNIDQIAELRELGEKMGQWISPFEQNPSAFYRADKPTAVFHGPIGDYKIDFNGEQRGSDFRGFFDVTAPGAATAVPLDAQALAYAVSHVDDFHKLYTSALDRAEKGAVVQKQQQERAAEENVAAEKQGSEQRLKEYRAAAEAKFTKAAADREVQQTKEKEKQEEARIDAEYARKLLNKIAMFKASPDGAKLWTSIEQQINTVRSMEDSERAYLRAMEKELTQAIVDKSPDADRRILRYAEAGAAHRDSPDLSKKKEELKRALQKFNQTLGISYQEAIRTQQAAISGVQRSLDLPTSSP